MVQAQVDLETPRGDDNIFDVVITSKTGKVVNLTGGTLKFTARAKSGSPSTVMTKTSAGGAGITFTDAINGYAALTLVPADTSALYAPVALVFDFEFTDALGKVTTVLPKGILYVLRDITHA